MEIGTVNRVFYFFFEMLIE